MIKLSVFASLIFFAMPSFAEESEKQNPYLIEPIQYIEYNMINGYNVWAEHNPNLWGHNFFCRMHKEFPVNGKTSFLVTVNSSNENYANVVLTNLNWKIDQNENYEFNVRFGFPEDYNVKNEYFSKDYPNSILTKHPIQKFLRNLSVTDQLRFSYNGKILADFNLSGIAPAVDELNRCIADQTKSIIEGDKRRILQIRDALGQEFKPAHPNPFEK